MSKKPSNKRKLIRLSSSSKDDFDKPLISQAGPHTYGSICLRIRSTDIAGEPVGFDNLASKLSLAQVVVDRVLIVPPFDGTSARNPIAIDLGEVSICQDQLIREGQPPMGFRAS